MDTKILELYVDNFKSNQFPIEWMEIKEKYSNDVLLKIPYSPLIKTNKFMNAIYKQKVFLEDSKLDIISKSIKNLYKTNEIIFSDKFLEEKIGKEHIVINIDYDFDKGFTNSHLYFLNLLTTEGPFQMESVDINKMTLNFASTRR